METILTQYVMLAIGIMFTPLSDDVLMVTHLTITAVTTVPEWIVFLSTWIVFTFAFSWFYLIGRGLNRFIPTSKRDSRYLRRAEALYARYGARVILVSYFIPGLRHPIHYVAGFTSLSFRTYTFYNVLSALGYTGTWFTVIQLAERVAIFQQAKDWILSL